VALTMHDLRPGAPTKLKPREEEDLDPAVLELVRALARRAARRDYALARERAEEKKRTAHDASP